MKPCPVFIVGPARSGTELLRSMLNRHPSVHIVEETHYFDDLRPRVGGAKALTARTRAQTAAYFAALAQGRYGSGEPSDGEAPALPPHGATADEVFQAFCAGRAARDGKALWGEKTPRHVFRGADILTAFPDARIIATVREPAAVVASYRHWRTTPAVDASEGSLRESRRVRASYSLTVSAMMWSAAVQAAARLQQRFGADRVRLQHYEALVQAPQATLADLCTWLRIDFDPAMLRAEVVNSTYLPDGAPGVQPGAIDRWRSVLSPREIGYVQWLTRPAAARHGYAAVAAELSLPFAAQQLAATPFQAARALLANRNRIGALPQFVLARLGSLLGPTDGVPGRRTRPR